MEPPRKIRALHDNKKRCCWALRLLISVALIVIVPPALAQIDTLEVMAVEYPPFTSEYAEQGGLSFQRLNLYSAENLPASRVFKPVFVPPARAEQLLKSRQFCLSFFPPQEEVRDYEFFALDQETIRIGLIRKRQAGLFQWLTLAELSGQKMAILRSNMSSALQESFEQAGIERVFVETVEQGLRMLRLDYVDLVFGDNTSLDELSGRVAINANDYQFSETSLFETSIGFFYRKDCKSKIFGR